MFFPLYLSQDCLYLNVHVPKVKKKAPPKHLNYWQLPTLYMTLNFQLEGTIESKLPVMVWIHGGAFEHGASNDFRPDYFMDEDVILVTINYRLGTFGMDSVRTVYILRRHSVTSTNSITVSHRLPLYRG